MFLVPIAQVQESFLMPILDLLPYIFLLMI